MMVEAFDERNINPFAQCQVENIRNWALKKKLLRMTAELCNLLGNRKMHAPISIVLKLSINYALQNKAK